MIPEQIVAAAFRDEIEKIALEKRSFIGLGGGHLALGHRDIPAHLQLGYYNLLGVIPIPDINIRVGGERLGFSAGPTSIGIDGGLPRGSHLVYSPGVPGMLSGTRSRIVPLRRRRRERR